MVADVQLRVLKSSVDLFRFASLTHGKGNYVLLKLHKLTFGLGATLHLKMMSILCLIDL